MRSRSIQTDRWHGFTLVELLVVISVIALLLGILMPALNKARQIARRTACQAQLHNISFAFRMYLDQNNNTMPPAAGTPYAITNSAADFTQPVYPGKPPIVYYLGSYLSVPNNELAQIGSKKVYCKVLSCPADRNISQGTSQYYGMAQYYFKTQTTSYQYHQSLGGQMLDTRSFRSSTKVKDIEAIGDFDAFHGPKPTDTSAASLANVVGSYNYLFCDCHVADIKGY